MYKSKQTMFGIFLIAVLSVGMYMVGCDSSTIESSNVDFNESPNLLNRDDNSEVFIACTELFKLDNGIAVSIYERCILDDKNLIKVTYPVDGIQRTRLISVSYSLKEAKIYDEYNSFVYGYKFSLDTVTNQLSLTNWTSQDTLITTFGNTGLYQSYNLNGTIIENSFVSQDESELALYLFETYDSVSILNQTQSEQDLFSQIANINQMTNIQNSLFNNVDAEVVSYLIAKDRFIDWFYRNNSIQSTDLSIACAFAGLGTLTCFFPPLVLVCVPSTGIATACAIAAIALWMIS